MDTGDYLSRRACQKELIFDAQRLLTLLLFTFFLIILFAIRKGSITFNFLLEYRWLAGRNMKKMKEESVHILTAIKYPPIYFIHSEI